MKPALTLLLAMIPMLDFAQTYSPVQSKVDSLNSWVDKIPALQSKKDDSLKAKYSKHKESVLNEKARAQTKLNKLDQNNAINNANHRLDSLNPGPLLVGKANQKLDSLSYAKKSAHINHRLDSTTSAITEKLDSLLRQPLITGKMATLQSRLDSLKNSRAIEAIFKTQKKLGEGQNGVERQFKNLEDNLNKKFSGFNENGGNVGSLNILGLIGKTGLNGLGPNTGLKLPSSMGKLEIRPQLLKVPMLNVTKLEIPQLNTRINTSAMGKQLKSGKIPEIGNLKFIQNIPGAEGLSKVQGQLNNAGQISKQVEVYSADIKKMAKGDLAEMDQLPKALQTKVENTVGVKGLTGQAGTYTDMIKKLESDPGLLKEMAVKELKEQALNHFAGHEKELMAAVSQLSKMKMKFKDIETVVDLLNKPMDPIKKKSFVERLLLGTGLQVQSSTNQWFDFTPYAGYRLAGKLTLGIGWMERLSANFNKGEFISKEHAYGPRIFTEFRIKDNLHARAEVEYINALVNSPYVTVTSLDGRASVVNYLVGIKKSFRFSNSLNGNVQAMYNLYNPLHRSPYLSDVMVRIGFEFLRTKRRGDGLVK